MKKILERDIQRSIITYLKKNGYLHLKLSDRFHSGYPDLIIMKQSRICFVELKTPTGKISPIQTISFKKFWDHGFQVEIVRSLDDFKEIEKIYFKDLD